VPAARVREKHCPRDDDGGFSGGSMDRPALQRLLPDIRAGLVFFRRPEHPSDWPSKGMQMHKTAQPAAVLWRLARACRKLYFGLWDE
jgi:hypothetical protein